MITADLRLRVRGTPKHSRLRKMQLTRQRVLVREMVVTGQCGR